jgi:ubiquinone/menaquinone biosynthesis C-methylase UbiE
MFAVPKCFFEKGLRMDQEILEARFTHEEIVRKYNLIASVYDLFGILMASKARQCALEMARIRNGERVLEVALGTGLNFIEILKRNPRGWVQGVDVSKKMLEKTRKRITKVGHRNYDLHLCDCRHLPFEDESFDMVMNEYLLDILPVEDFDPILKEFGRVLRPGGRIVLVNTTKGEKWINQIYELLYRMKPPIVAGSRGVRAQPFLEAAGFSQIQRQYVSQFGFPSEAVRGVKR